MPRINVIHDKTTLRIYMNELLHVCVKKRDMVGVRSHIQEVPLTDIEYKGRKWVITFICKGKHGKKF
jgi:hypothetical protein